jgi:DNA-binding transcriptional ArsR family regulator
MRSLAALADPTRKKIVEMLAHSDLGVGEIVGKFDMSPPAISQHLKVLREAGLVRVRARAQHRIYQLDMDGLVEIEGWLSQMRDQCHERLKQLVTDEDERISVTPINVVLGSLNGINGAPRLNPAAAVNGNGANGMHYAQTALSHD